MGIDSHIITLKSCFCPLKQNPRYATVVIGIKKMIYPFQYKLEASFLEIYNETIRDLLTHHKEPVQHDIKLDASHPGGVYITNVTPVTVSSQSQVARLLERAAQNRAVAATNCNERSSRSHSVFRLQLTGSNKITGENCKGQCPVVN